ILVSAGSSTFEMGVLKCAKNLERCKAIDISLFKTLDVGKDNSNYAKQVLAYDGSVNGRACMSQADCDKIKATQADKCNEANIDKSCYCTTDKCNGSAGALSLISLLISEMFGKVVVLASVFYLAQALNCYHQATTTIDPLIMGNFNGTVVIPLDIGSYLCEDGLIRCATF
ncbi:hypothetical protein PFISCL1PPCAC_4164, partial [Pristionchus fissidentatus]